MAGEGVPSEFPFIAMATPVGWLYNQKLRQRPTVGCPGGS